MNTKFSLEIESLPTLPVIAGQIMECVNNPGSSVQDVADVILRDQSMSTKILKLVNSAFYGFPKRIGTISHAISILGFETVRGLVLGLSILDMFQINEFDLLRFWKHSIRTASINAFLAEKFFYSRRDEAFTVGLIHDVGKLVFMLRAPDLYHEVLRQAEDVDLLVCEQQLLGIEHAEAGALVARTWNFPEIYIQAIQQHHQVPVSPLIPISLPSMLYFANWIDELLEQEAEISPAQIERLKLLNLTFDELVAYMNSIHQEVHDFLQLLTPQ